MFKVLRDLLRYNREFLIGFILTASLVIYASLHFFSPYDNTAIYLLPPDMPPSPDYWLGTTSRGQDIFWQISAALWNTMTFGITVTVISRMLALTMGMISGYIGGRGDRVLMTINDTLIALPNLPILLLVYFVMREQMNWAILAVVTACLSWNYDARIIRSVALSLRQREFTRHAVYAGMSMPQVLVRQHMPYVMPIVFFTAMNNLIFAIGIEVTLAVLGFIDLNRPTIGGMINWANQHQAIVAGVWWWIAFPIIAIVLLFLGLFLLAISINEYIDPRSRLARMGG
ncbi:peptide ABC transporter [Devosia pacifica]|uniref:Peptide ABC transporter n=1 Tax=Devosia pacifica TaxID=1335967 RepID=A0A918VS92_9HYPH|nr:ABC transporter permease [Devosia pacifica]GHA18146.1 peptide ABC transporter [Devosia pacifica]